VSRRRRKSGDAEGKAAQGAELHGQRDKSDEDLIKVVTEGGMDMPSFGKKLSPEQIQSLVKNDVRSFGKKI
jgi:mono/diheme cytochrome c family protein